jgi:predicted DNA-binding transcriptional regulator AlpA
MLRAEGAPVAERDSLASLAGDELLRAAVRELQRLNRATAAGQAALLPRRQAAELCGCSIASFARAVAAGQMPQPVRGIGGVRWRRADLLRAIEKLKT